MKIDKFVTSIYKGHFSISEKFEEIFDDWADFEKTLNPEGCLYSTTQHGWQYSFSREKIPRWLEEIFPHIQQIKQEINCLNLKSSWVVDYSIGGYQDPHFHQPEDNLYTIVINLFGNGELLLHDPRPIAICHGNSIVEIETLQPGDWIAIPSWLVHSSRPSTERRIIYVMDIFK